MAKKIAIFDMDGTLIAPYFLDEDETRRSFPADEWIEYCNRRGEDAYYHCSTIIPMFVFAELLKKKENYELHIATVTISNAEIKAKARFKERNEMLDMFEPIHFVENDDAKIALVKRYAETYGPENVILVDDLFDNVIKANELGCKGLHVSHAIDHVWEWMAGQHIMV